MNRMLVALSMVTVVASSALTATALAAVQPARMRAVLRNVPPGGKKVYRPRTSPRTVWAPRGTVVSQPGPGGITGKGTVGKAVRFQIRPDPLAH